MPYNTYYTNGSGTEGFISIEGRAVANWTTGSVKVTQESGIHPQLYFTYVKKKMGLLEKMRFEKRIKKLEGAFDAAVANGQSALADKFLLEVVREARESQMFARGLKLFIEKSDLLKYKNKIRGGHISDTQFKDFTRVVPKDVLAKKAKVDDLFDGFVIYHYWNPENKDIKKMSNEERSKMRDPILFGWIKESDRLYFVADWEDEFCDLTFDEVVDLLGKEEHEVTLTKNPKLE